MSPFSSTPHQPVALSHTQKGSLPVCRIKAHSSKIYGIDWSHDVRNEIVTCSLDKTIKVWDMEAASAADTKEVSKPKTIIQTTYPVWRARNLPFGRGVLSLAQRGATTLEMYAQNNPQEPAEIFEGHIDVVKEFVWRKGGNGAVENFLVCFVSTHPCWTDDFQLITWSKDRTLRFWPVNSETMQVHLFCK
jgi:WD40 repeat protein